MIIGIGTDIIKISRIQRLIAQKDAISMLLTVKEQQSKKSIRSIAGIFAVKEALLKALGIGFSMGLGRLLEIEVLHEKSGKPYVITSGVVNRIKEQKRINSIQISISHEAEYAVAVVICEECVYLN